MDEVKQKVIVDRDKYNRLLSEVDKKKSNHSNQETKSSEEVNEVIAPPPGIPQDKSKNIGDGQDSHNWTLWWIEIEWEKWTSK